MIGQMHALLLGRNVKRIEFDCELVILKGVHSIILRTCRIGDKMEVVTTFVESFPIMSQKCPSNAIQYSSIPFRHCIIHPSRPPLTSRTTLLLHILLHLPPGVFGALFLNDRQSICHKSRSSFFLPGRVFEVEFAEIA